MVGEWLTTAVGSAVRVAAGFILAGVLAVVTDPKQDIGSLTQLAWWHTLLIGAVGVAVPIVIAALNKADPRFGKGKAAPAKAGG